MPRALDPDAFLSLPPEWHAEARARTAFLVLRGALPAKALENAVRGMADDETWQERLASWDSVAAVCKVWPAPGRKRDGSPVQPVFDLAASIDAMAEAAVAEGHAEDPYLALQPLCPDAHVLAAALDAYRARLALLAPPAAGEGPAGDPEEEYRRDVEEANESWLDESMDKMDYD